MSRRRASAALLTLATGAMLLTGCHEVTGGTAATPSSKSSAQSDLRAPVKAVATEGTAPVRLTIGDADAEVDAVATDAQGALYPPVDVRRLGWWVDSALPGSGAGSVVVTGHIDDARQGDGFAKRFSNVANNSELTLRGKDGTQVRYRVTRSAAVAKNALPAADLNRLDGPETLILVTCGGRFIGPPLGYDSNEIVYAQRVA